MGLAYHLGTNLIGQNKPFTGSLPGSGMTSQKSILEWPYAVITIMAVDSVEVTPSVHVVILR